MPGSESFSIAGTELVSNAHDLPVLSVCDGRVARANDAACRLFGTSPMGMHAEDLFVSSCRAKVRDFLGGGTPRMAELIVDQGGVPVVVKFVALAAGTDTLWIANGVGASYPQEVGMKLMSANRELTNLTRELALRVHELDATRQTLVRSGEAQERLRKELEELERLREEWAAIVAHDLRQPVSTIGLAAGTVLKTASLREKERLCMERIHAASRRLDRMIADLTEVSQVESKRMSIHTRWLDVEGLVRAFVDTVRETTPGEITLAFRGDTCAWVDPDRIHQILGNLLSNAVKYRREDTPVGIAAVEKGRFVEVCVENEGGGIPADQLPHLFRRFARMREARESRVTGLGVGLYITKGLVEAHGGRLWVESTPGASTCFRFTVPKQFTTDLDSRDGTST